MKLTDASFNNCVKSSYRQRRLKGKDKKAYTYFCERGPRQRERLWRRAEGVRVLLRCVHQRQDLWSRHVRAGSAAYRRVSVRVVTLWLHLRRRRGHRVGGRSVTPHGTLINCSAKRGGRRIHLRARRGLRSHGDTAGKGRGAHWCRGRRRRRRGGRRRAWRLADGGERVTAGHGAGEVVERRGGRPVRRGLTEEAVFFSDISGIN